MFDIKRLWTHESFASKTTFIEGQFLGKTNTSYETDKLKNSEVLLFHLIMRQISFEINQYSAPFHKSVVFACTCWHQLLLRVRVVVSCCCVYVLPPVVVACTFFRQVL